MLKCIKYDAQDLNNNYLYISHSALYCIALRFAQQ